MTFLLLIVFALAAVLPCLALWFVNEPAVNRPRG
jgi:hypothetical protein